MTTNAYYTNPQSRAQGFSWGAAFKPFVGAAAGLAGMAGRVFGEFKNQAAMKAAYEQLDSLADGKTALFDKEGKMRIDNDTYVKRAIYWMDGFSRDTEFGIRSLTVNMAQELKGIPRATFVQYIAQREEVSNKRPLNDRLANRFSHIDFQM
jgi:hypothetical protein